MVGLFSLFELKNT
jgi:hypothetical protein